MKTLFLILLVVGLILLAGCSSGDDYSRPPSGPTGGFVGGGCGVAGNPVDDSNSRAVDSFESLAA